MGESTREYVVVQADAAGEPVTVTAGVHAASPADAIGVVKALRDNGVL